MALSLFSIPKIGDKFYTSAFTVMENQGHSNSVDFLLGLDMLKRHQCCIDLGKNMLILPPDNAVPFLSEHDLPESARLTSTEDTDVKGEKSSGSGSGTGEKRKIGEISATAPTHPSPSLPAPTASSARPPVATGPSPAAGPAPSHAGPVPGPTGSGSPPGLQMLLDIGFPRDAALEALASTGGNVELAATLLFSGGM